MSKLTQEQRIERSLALQERTRALLAATPLVVEWVMDSRARNLALCDEIIEFLQRQLETIRARKTRL